jgi:ribonuclease HI
MPAVPDVPTLAYTDGACSGNPGPGGWAWAVPDGPWASGAEARTTNQRMELTAALEAVRANPGRLEVVSDSTYVVNCFRDRWWEGWQRRGWKNAKKEPVANRDLWEPLVDLVTSRGDVTFRWVKGHSGDPMNDVVDRLAVEAAATQEGRTGTGTPEDLGPADRAVTAPGSGRDPRLPAGTLVLVAGLRPTELGGYDDNPVADAVRARIGEALDALRSLHGEITVVSGLRLGAEQLGVEAAASLEIGHVAVLPYPDPDSVWPPASRARFAALRDAALSVVQLEGKAPASKQAAGAALARRDAWLARQVDAAVVVWDGRDDTVGRLLGLLEVHLDDGEVILVRP